MTNVCVDGIQGDYVKNCELWLYIWIRSELLT